MTELLSSSLDALKGIRDELQGSVDDSVIRQIDGLIHDWQAALEKGPKGKISAQDILTSLGQVLKWLPEIIDIVERLR